MNYRQVIRDSSDKHNFQETEYNSNTDYIQVIDDNGKECIQVKNDSNYKDFNPVIDDSND